MKLGKGRFWHPEPSLVHVAVGIGFLLGLAAFAYFAHAVDNFPGELGASTWVQSWRTSWLDTLMKAISVPGLLPVAAPVLLLASAALYLKGWRAESLLVLGSTVAGRVLSLALKEVVARPRPSEGLVQVLREADGYSFPSGHAMHYAAFLGALAVVLAIRIRPGIALWASQLTLAVALAAIGLSRIYLGAHWFGDVVGGYAFGAVVVGVSLWLWRGRTRGDSGAAPT